MSYKGEQHNDGRKVAIREEERERGCAGAEHSSALKIIHWIVPHFFWCEPSASVADPGNTIP